MIVITTLSEEEEIFLLEVIRKLIINITFLESKEKQKYQRMLLIGLMYVLIGK